MRKKKAVQKKAVAAAKKGGKAAVTSSKSVVAVAALDLQNEADLIFWFLISLFSLICWIVGSQLYDDGD